MRLSIASLRRGINGELRGEFVRQNLTSYGGLERRRRSFRPVGLHHRRRDALRSYDLGGDYDGARLALLLLALRVVGSRRIAHLHYLAHDPAVARLPTDRTAVAPLK